jgi:WD repeat-containing protein 24
VLPERKLTLKRLGDKSRMPVLQNMGLYVRAGLRDPESGGLFEHLARKYLVESDGGDRITVCKENAEVSALLMSRT